MHNLAILIPAAGASSRMRGADKLLELVDGLPLLRRQAKRAMASGAHVLVTVPDYDHPRAVALSGLPVQMVAVPDARLGMSASLRRGISLLPPGMAGAMILPGDMPDITKADISLLVSTFRALPHPALVQATTPDGQPGHPVVFPSDCFSALLYLNGDKGARDVLTQNRHRLRYVALPDQHAITDLDTPEAWKAWRGSREQKDIQNCV